MSQVINSSQWELKEIYWWIVVEDTVSLGICLDIFLEENLGEL